MLELYPDTAGEIVFTHDVSSWKSVDIALADFMDATKVLGYLSMLFQAL